MTNQLESPEQQLSIIPAIISIAALLVATVAISWAAIFIKLSEREISPNATIFNRLWIATVVFGLWNGLNGVRQRLSDNPPVQQQPYTSRDLGLLLAVGTFFSLAQVLWAWSLTQTSVAISGVLHNLTPLFTTLGGWLLFGQRFDAKFLIGMVVAIGGACAIGLEDWLFATGKFQGDIFAFLSAIFYGAYLLCLEQLRSKFSTPIIMLWVCALGVILSLSIVAIAQDTLFPHSRLGWLAVISLALLCQGIGQGLTAYSLNKLSSGVVALSNLLNPPLTGTIAWAIFSERLSFSNWVAFVVVLVGIYLAITARGAVKASSEPPLV